MSSKIMENLKPDEKLNHFYLKFQEMVKKYKLNKGGKFEDINEKDFRESQELYLDFLKNRNPFYFKIQPSDKLPKILLELFSIKMGENLSFQERDPYWPLNNSRIYSKPILKYKEEYYGFGSTIIYRNIIEILELLIQEKNQNYYINKYLKKKAKILEKLSLQYLHNIFPNAQVYNGLFYERLIAGEKRRFEVDGLIIYDENLFIIEAKAHKLTISAKRGSIPRIEKISKEVIDKAYKQGIRCKNYIIKSKNAKFMDKNGNEVVSIHSNDFRGIYIINTTFESLSHLSTQLHDLDTFNFIKDKEWPWTVFINDLRIISEIIESPSIFLLYLQRRLRMNDFELFTTSDELDYFMFFLKKGMYFEDIQFSKKQKISLFGFTDELDRYYNYLQGYIKEAEKPIFNISDYIKMLVQKLEISAQKGFTFASIALLGLDSKDHELISSLMKKHKDLSFKTRKDYKSFFGSKKLSIGLIFVIRTNTNIKDWSEFRNFLKIMMYKYQLQYGIMYKSIFNKKSDCIPDLDFEIIEKEWEFDLKLEKESNKNNLKGMRIVKG